MIDGALVRERASQLYSDIKKRSKPTYAKKSGRMTWPGVPVPYDRDHFASWLLATIGCRAFLCPYCNAPLDVLSMTLDHDRALKAGGDNSLDNLVPCCGDCNGLKHKLTGKQYLAFRKALRELGPVVEANVLSRLRAGALGQRMMWEAAAKKKPSLVTGDEPF